MIEISPELARNLPAERVPVPYQIRGRRRQMLSEAKACTTNAYLIAWRDQSRDLVAHLESAVTRDEVKIDALEAAIPVAEAAVVAEQQAIDARFRAQAVYAAGSLDRETQLRNRDDVEAAVGALAVRTREREAAVRRAWADLPQNAGVDEATDIRNMVEALARVVINRRFYPERVTTIDRETWKRWLETTSAEELRWLPLHAARVIAEAEGKRAALVGPERRYENGGVREEVILPVDAFVEELRQFKLSREAYIQRKVAAARTALENATAHAAALEGAAQ